MTKSKKIAFISLMALASLLLSSCGGGSSSNSSSNTSTSTEGGSKEDLVNDPKVEAQASGGFDNAITTPDGSSFTLSSPTTFTPGKFASGQVPGQTFNRFTVTVKNGGSSPLELYALIVKGSTSGGECVDIFDGDNKIDGAPQDALAAGTSLSFNWALSCPGKSGADLKVVLLNGETGLIEAKGKLA